MLSNNKKTLLISSLIFTGFSIGGVVNAGQTDVNAGQTGVNAGQANGNQSAPQHDQFPAASALPQIASNSQKPNTAQPVAGVARPQTRMAPPPYPMSRNTAYPGANRFAPPMPPQYNSPNGANAFRPNSVPMTAPFGPGPSPYAAGPYGQQRPYNSGPYNSGPRNYAPRNNGPYNSGPYNQGPYGNRPNNNRGSFGNNPMDNFGFGPFSKNSNTAPWETWPFGGQDSLWNRREIPFKDQSPTDWFQPGDPKEGMAIMWDDMISSPDELGEMPGGWNVPSISVPNPVDLEDQLEKASKEVPDLIRVYN